jgi:hypothetical protein
VHAFLRPPVEGVCTSVWLNATYLKLVAIIALYRPVNVAVGVIGDRSAAYSTSHAPPVECLECSELPVAGHRTGN